MGDDNEKRKLTFEECYDLINKEIKKRSNKWSLTSLNWIDYDDVSQIIRIHIYEKWHLYDTQKPLVPWLNRIISNQIKNLIRNNYGSFARPCLKCEAAEGESGCKIYKVQCLDCPLYGKWEKNKKSAYNIKIPLSIEKHSVEVNSIRFEDDIDIENQIKKVHIKMKQILKPNEWIVYEGLYIQNLEENEVAEKLGFKSNEKSRNPGYKQINNIKKTIIKKVKECIRKEDIEIY